MAEANLNNRTTTGADYYLIEPQGGEPVDINDLNHNFEIINAELTALANQGTDVDWANIENIPENLAYTEQIPTDYTQINGAVSETEVIEILDDYVGGNVQQQLREIRADLVEHDNELTDHETRITALENKDMDIGLFYQDGLIMCRYEV